MGRLRVSLCLLAILVFTLHARAADWQQPTPDELSMTAERAAPNSEAVILYTEETTDDKLHMSSVYMRLKTLKDAGKRFGDVEIDNFGGYSGITDIQGRTIHGDGSVVPFTGKPYEKLIVKSASWKYKAKVFSLPDVQTGSILEYRYKLRYDDNRMIAPDWRLQHEVYVRRAHYHFVPTEHEVISYTDQGAVSSSLAYSQILPKGAALAQAHGNYDLEVKDIPAEPAEEYMPPMRAFGYRVRFYYTGYRTMDEFWPPMARTGISRWISSRIHPRPSGMQRGRSARAKLRERSWRSSMPR